MIIPSRHYRFYFINFLPPRIVPCGKAPHLVRGWEHTPALTTSLIYTKPCLTTPCGFSARGRSKHSARRILSVRCRSSKVLRPGSTFSSSKVSGEPSHEAIRQSHSFTPSSPKYSTARPEKHSCYSTTSPKSAPKNPSQPSNSILSYGLEVTQSLPPARYVPMRNELPIVSETRKPFIEAK